LPVLYTGDYQYSTDDGHNGTWFECSTCLTDLNNNPIENASLFHGIPTEISPFISRLLLYVGVYDNWSPIDPSGSHKGNHIYFREYSSYNRSLHFLNDLHIAVPKVDGSPSTDVPAKAALYAAHLAARLPVLAVLGADRFLPRVTRDEGARERLIVNTSLEVKWHRVGGVLLAILAGQLIAIGVIFLLCKRVFMRDHYSFLSIARLLKTAITAVPARSVDTGEELAEAIEKANVRMKYGTKEVGGDTFEVDLWDDFDNGPSCQFPDKHYQ
jgi:hypothetical protein